MVSVAVRAAARVQTSIARFFLPPRPLPSAPPPPKVVKSAPSARAPRPEATPRPRSRATIDSVPAFKRIPATPFVVDAFACGAIDGALAYFLTHYHSDHYRGLSGAAARAYHPAALVYCSPVTANLVHRYLDVPDGRLCRLDVGKMYLIHGRLVGVLDANHCPGSVMFVFGERGHGAAWTWCLHTGDFRAHPRIMDQVLVPADALVASVTGPVNARHLLYDCIYLDTTYADPKYVFPAQSAAVAACVEHVHELLVGAKDPQGQQRLAPLKLLVVFGSYFIGKERLVLALAERLDCTFYADQRKRAVLKELHWPQLTARLTEEPHFTAVHLASMAICGRERLGEYLESFEGRFTHVLGIRPTGWTFEERENSEPAAGTSGCPLSIKWHDWSFTGSNRRGHNVIGICGVPYSEHSSYAELADFLKQIAFRRVLPTVDNWGSTVWDLQAYGGDADRLLAALSKKR